MAEILTDSVCLWQGLIDLTETTCQNLNHVILTDGLAFFNSPQSDFHQSEGARCLPNPNNCSMI